ncbi:MAG: hypothetical protein AAB686_00525, partial [Patescibacteria group bacterium]
MMDNAAAIKELAKILETDGAKLASLDAFMSKATGRRGVPGRVLEMNREMADAALRKINSGIAEAAHVRGVLRQAIVRQEKEFMNLLNQIPDHDEFGRMAKLAEQMVKTNHGHFLKKDLLRQIFTERPPANLLEYLGYKRVEDLIAKEDLTECMSALRFVETNEWMHETFEKVYGRFTPADFEERRVELRVLGPKWHDVSKKFVAKKHHNVSHLKEFGVIFLNPIAENIPGKLLRDFALLLHYFHEVQFYSKLFAKHFDAPDFAERLKSLLRGDVEEVKEVGAGEWLIVQRYL